MLTKQKFSVNVLNKILSDFDLGKIKKIEPLATSGNISYLIKTNKNIFFLRLCSTGPRWRSKKEIMAEIELLEYLKAKNFPVIVPFKSKNEEKIISWSKHYGYIRKFVVANAKLNPSVAEIKKFGKVIGKFHNLVKNFKTKNKRQHIFGLVETQKCFKQKKGEILKSDFKNKKEFVARFEKEIFSLNFPKSLVKGMIHEDLGKRHVLWQGSKITAIVDFDRSYFGFLILDLGEAIRGWCFTNNWQKWNDKKFKALLGGYQRKRKLTKIEKQYLFDAIKFAVLERALSFCLRYIHVTEDKADEKFALDSVFKQINLIPNKSFQK